MKHNSIARLRSIPPLRRALSALFIVLSLITAFAAFGVPLNTSWTYQGQLQRSGAVYNGTCNFQFSLWDAASAGTQQGSTLSINSVNVANGLFTVVLDFGISVMGYDQFTGDARWLATSVQCSGDGGFTQLDPRQPITATPYALSLRPGARIIGDGTGFGLLFVQSIPPGGYGLIGQSVEGTGVRGDGFGPNSQGVYGSANGADSAGVYGKNADSAAIWGESFGVGSAIYGKNFSTGYAGRFIGPVSVEGTLTKSAGSFRIDHPLDPANKFLSHSFVESPDMKNIYDGNVTTDATGSAIVTLPAYFEALNRDFRYQLTVLGQFAQAVVSRKITGTASRFGPTSPALKFHGRSRAFARTPMLERIRS